MTVHALRWLARRPGDLGSLDLVEVEVPDPGPGEVRIDVRAAGMNPADVKQVTHGQFDEPVLLGYEVSGVVAALGPDTQLASGGGAVGDEVVAFRVHGGYASALTVPAADVFAKPATLDHPEAANLLLAGATAADMLRVAGVGAGDTIVVHGASGAVGLSVLQQARLLGVRVVGTASEARFEEVRRFGGEPVTYGEGLLQRLRAAAPQGYAAALDAIGTDEAVDTSLELLDDPARVVSIAAFGRAGDGIRLLGGTQGESAAFRAAVRPRLLQLAGQGDLVVPVARTFPLAEAREAMELLGQGHPGGKLALIP